MPNEPMKHMIDGREMTVDEIAELLGCSKRALYVRRCHMGRVSYQLIVDMYRRNQIGSDKCHRFLVDGRWMTTGEIAQMLGIKKHTLVTWRCNHRRPDGTPAPMAEAITWYRQDNAGERPRYQNRGGRQAVRYRVGRGTVSAPDVASKYGVSRVSVYKMMARCGGDMGRVIRHYRDRERKRVDKAQAEILRILTGG